MSGHVSRPPEYYQSVMIRWRSIAARAGMGEQEMAVMAAQFAGLAIARVPISVEGQCRLLALAYDAMCKSTAGAVGIREGWATPMLRE